MSADATPATAEVVLSRDNAYLRENYLQWLVYRSRVQRWLLLFSPFFLLLAIWMPHAQSGQPVFPSRTFLILFVLIGLVGPFVEYALWKRKLLAGRDALPDLVLRLHEGRLLFSNRGSDAREPAIRILHAKKVWKGIFLLADGRRHLYLPGRWSNRPDVQAILRSWENADARD